MARALVSPTAGKINCRIANVTKKPVLLKRNCVIANLWQLPDINVVPYDDEHGKSGEFNTVLNSSVDINNTSQSEVDEILNDIGVHLSKSCVTSIEKMQLSRLVTTAYSHKLDAGDSMLQRSRMHLGYSRL